MRCWWHQFEQFLWWGGTPEGAVFILGMSVVAGLNIGLILIALDVIRSIPQAWREGMAEARAKRLAKQGLPTGDAHPAPPSGDVPPTSDI
jgi:hypothetical protein